MFFLVLTACIDVDGEPADRPDEVVLAEEPDAETGDWGVEDTDSAPVVPPPTGYGSIVATHAAQYGSIYIQAAFIANPTGFLNTVECITDWGLCIDAVPTALDVPVDVVGDAHHEDLTFQSVGSNPRIGAFHLARVSSDFLYQDDADTWEEGPLDVSWAASSEWAAYSGTGVFPMAETIVADGPFDRVVARDGTLDLTWTKGTDPLQLDVIANRVGGTQVRRTYALEDDGVFSLSIADLGLQPEDHALTVELARVRYASIDVDGNPVHLTSRSELYYRVDVIDPTRTEVVGTSSCEDAVALGSGRYRGVLPETPGQLNPGLPCTGSSSATGHEALFAIDLEPGEQVVVQGRVTHDLQQDSILYLLTDCASASSCIAGDRVANADLVYANDGLDPETITLVVDSHRLSGAFEFDVDIRPTPNPMGFADTCAELGPPVVGSISGSLVDLQSSSQGCTVPNHPGPDGLVPVSVGPGERLRVRALGNRVSLYLLDVCGDEKTCLAITSGGPEVDWVNNGTEDRLLTVVVDSSGSPWSAGPSQSITLDIQLEQPVEVLPAEDCATLPSGPLLRTGAHRLTGSTAFMNDDLDLAVPGPSCTVAATDGADGLFRVALEPGQTVSVDYWVQGGVAGAVYLLEDCSDTRSLLACGAQDVGWNTGSGPALFSWTHTGTNPIEATLVVDSRDTFGFGGIFYLDVDIE